MADAEEMAAFAKKEVTSGFPVLNANAVLSLWAHLEASIRLFLAKWIENEKSAIDIDLIQKMRVKIGEYEKLQGEERYFYILDRLEQEAVAPLNCGVGRFESILELFGLSGKVAPDVQKAIFELNQVRNCLMHRAGRADRRFLDSCPWMNLEMGQPLKLVYTDFRRYFEATVKYATELICRIAERFGVDMREFR